MIFLRLLIVLLAIPFSKAIAAECPNKDILGTTRTLSIAAKEFPRVGLKSFPQTLPLNDNEVVLTFDDGPFPPTTTRILAALSRECVQATFFLIGKSAEANPDLVKKIAASGHTIGHHTWSHPNLSRIAQSTAVDQIDKGIAADERALGSDARSSRETLFFRFPGFASTPALLENLANRRIAVFGADLWASDWNVMKPQRELQLLIERLKEAKKGIVLLHDTKVETANMLPAFLQYLHRNGYKVVHIVPATPDQSAPNEH